MKILLYFSLAFVLAKSGCTASNVDSNSTSKQEKTETSNSKVESVQIAFYNVENLFDTINEAGKNDGEYTPEGKKNWNSKKYKEKLEHLNQVIASIDSSGELLAIGVAEIENLRVLQDLINYSFMKERGFQIVHQESPDFRGIDVAFMYNANKMKITGSEWININLPEKGKTTREILRVDAELKSENITFYINHWPSRWGGQEKSNPKRIAAAQALRKNIDKKWSDNPNEHIIIMGDLNDYPNNESVMTVLKADSTTSGALYNTTWQLHKEDNIGSHNYKGKWGMLDQIIVSNSFMPFVDSVYVFKKNWMCYQNKKGEWLPSRTHSGPKYYGGYSDHLPVIIKVEK